MSLTFNYDKLLMMGRLTDRAIKKYAKAGFYGPDEQQRALAREEKRTKIERVRKKQYDFDVYD